MDRQRVKVSEKGEESQNRELISYKVKLRERKDRRKGELERGGDEYRTDREREYTEQGEESYGKARLYGGECGYGGGEGEERDGEKERELECGGEKQWTDRTQQCTEKGEKSWKGLIKRMSVHEGEEGNGRKGRESKCRGGYELRTSTKRVTVQEKGKNMDKTDRNDECTAGGKEKERRKSE